MIKNFFKITIRNIYKHKGYSFINITGLALGIASCIFIFMWVQDELNFDRYNENVDNLYRVEEDQYYSGETYHVNVTPFPCAPVFKDKIPEVTNAARINWTGVLLKYGEKAFYETDAVGIDSTYLQMFTFEFLKGDINTALDEPYSIIMNEEMANKYFGDEDPIGKIVSLNNQYDFKVTGVFKKFPNNLSYSFEIAFPFKFFKELGNWSENWDSNSIFTFVELVPGANIELVNKKLTGLLRENDPESSTDYMVAPLNRMHLYSYFGYGHPTGAVQYIYMFSAIAIFILLIACINFMNLSTARSANRAMEIGVRKVIGASRNSLIRQFYGESLILSFIGLTFALMIVVLLLNEFNTFTGKEIALNTLSNSSFVVGALLITVIAGLIAGSYPALYLSAFRPVKVLKGTRKSGAKSSTFRRVLVVTQFTLSIFLIVSTIVVYNQMVFMKNKDLGYNKEQLLYIQMRGSVGESYEAIKTEFAKTEGVISVSGSNHPPHRIGSNSGGAEWDGKDEEQTVLIGTHVADYDYCRTVGIEILEGRGFSHEFPADLASEEDTVGGFLINEETVRVMGLDNKTAVGARFDFMGIDGTIVGIMKNFHYNSVRTEIEPLAIALAPDFLSYLTLRIAPGDIAENMDNVKSAWSSVVPSYPFEYRFVDEDFDRWYRREARMLSLLEIFAILAIIIACLGLFGLASFTAEQKTKEIGIRKVLGASEVNLTYIMCKEFVILIVISNLLAWPLAFWGAGSWLEEFAYRIDLNLTFFLLAGILSIVVALLTVSYQAIKAALANPINSLRYE